MEHCIDIEERTGSNYIVQKINKDLSGLPVLDLNCCIHRVSEGLCKAKRKAYQPIVVSIGPYHLKNPKLKAMKKHKLRYLHLLLERRKENVDRYVVELKKLEDRVRKCYVDPIDDLNSDDFVQMMLLDACFIIEFLGKKPLNTILNVDCMEFQINRDLMLLENQLPFFLLSHFYVMTKNPDRNPNNGPRDPDHDPDDAPEHPKPDPDNNPNNGLLRLILKSSIMTTIPDPLRLTSFLEYLKHDLREIKHLLHLVHVFCRPLPKQTASSELINTTNDRWDEIQSPMHSVVELEDAGVKFKAIGKWYKPTAHLFDITFDNGLMVVPCFHVGDSTETFFRNLIAFEQHSMDIVPKYFTEYAELMDQFINSEKDVKLLRDEGIIVNMLGDDKEISNLFNHLCDGVVFSSVPTSYVDIRKKANEYRNKPWNKMRAKLLRDYFNTPWAGISTIGAIVILLLSLLQTIGSFQNKP